MINEAHQSLMEPDRRLPAPWAHHTRTWMGWPCRLETWGNEKRLIRARAAVAALASVIREYEPVVMVVPPALVAEAREQLDTGIQIAVVPIDDCWIRDTAPVFTCASHGLEPVCFCFNGRGERYIPHESDARLGSELAQRLGLRPAESPLVAEGGAISTDGEGTVIATESCLLNPNRNPGRSKYEITSELRHQLGVTKVIWIPGNPDDMVTDGQASRIAAFAGQSTVVLESPTYEDQDHVQWIAVNLAALEGQTDARGRPLQIVPIESAVDVPVPDDAFCRSYVNFYPVNGAVIAPAYGQATDARARRVLERCFPNREIVFFPIADIAIGGGGIHAITREEPAL